ncbi:MAG: hypothetical protein U1F56_13885 [Rubrivivax sp.]
MSSQIDQSHQRCVALGVSRIERPDLSTLGRPDPQRRAQRNQRLYDHAAPVMELLYEQIVNLLSMVVLTDSDHRAALDRRRRLPRPRQQGGAGTAPTGLSSPSAGSTGGHRAHRGEAGARACRRALPARQPLPHLLGRAHPRPARQHPGVLDVSGDHRSYHQHTMALVKMSARMIENRRLYRRLPQRDAAALPQPGRVHRHADGRHLGRQR